MKRFLILIWTISLVVSSGAYALDLIEDFSAGNFNNWTILDGNDWSINNGQARANGTFAGFVNPTGLLQFDAIGSVSQFSLQADMGQVSSENTGNQAVGLAFGIQDANNYYTINFFPGFTSTPGALQFRQVVNGSNVRVLTDQNLGFVPAIGQLHTLRIDVDLTLNQITASVNNGVGDDNFDFVLTNITDNLGIQNFTTGGVGIYDAGSNGFFDNVKFSGNVNAIPEPQTLVALIFAIVSCFIKMKS